MSDSVMRIIATQPWFRPAPEALDAVIRRVRSKVPDADRIEFVDHGEIAFIDPGANLEHIRCPVCGSDVGFDWWSIQMHVASEAGFVRLDATAPCCGGVVSLNDLVYELPAGFALVEISITNPGRGWLSRNELGELETVFGHAVRQVLAHY